MLPTIEWQPDAVVMIDQRKLPGQEVYVHCKTAAEVARAIKTMVIRGAPAIGVAAAMGIALGMGRSKAQGTKQFAVEFNKLCDLMAGHAADRREPVLGHRADEAGVFRRRAGGEVGSRKSRTRWSAEATRDSRRGRRELQGDGPLRRGRRAGERADSDALQRRRAGDGGLRHGARRDSRGGGAGQGHAGLCRRDAAVSAGREADGLGARARQGADHRHYRKHGRAA